MAEPPLFSARIDRQLAGVHAFSAFVAATLVSTARRPFYANEILQQCYEVGVRTLPLATLTGLITGMVFTEQSRPSLASFGATSWLPSLVTLALVRSLAPLVTALVCAGKVGSSIGAELGSMKVTEQIEALTVSAVNPIKYLVVTRTIATTFMVPVLTAYFGFVAFLGAYFNVRSHEGTSWIAFVKNGFGSLDVLDVGSAVVRAVVFGFTIGIIACWSGVSATHGTQGVGRAANGAVVQSMLAIFVLEILIVQVISLVRSL
ncbi:MAG: ABC transporter permease [Alphaproteobacteria bacterium]|nr:ABC transporter permease [Alphaproteobacteria bacterium]